MGSLRLSLSPPSFLLAGFPASSPTLFFNYPFKKEGNNFFLV